MGIRWQWYAATLTCLIGAHRAAADVPWKTKTPYTTIAWVLPGGESPRGNPPKISDTNIVAGWLPSADKKQHLVVYAGGEIQTFSKFPKEDCKQVVVRPDGTVFARVAVPRPDAQVIQGGRGPVRTRDGAVVEVTGTGSVTINADTDHLLNLRAGKLEEIRVSGGVFWINDPDRTGDIVLVKAEGAGQALLTPRATVPIDMPENSVTVGNGLMTGYSTRSSPTGTVSDLYVQVRGTRSLLASPKSYGELPRAGKPNTLGQIVYGLTSQQKSLDLYLLDVNKKQAVKFPRPESAAGNYLYQASIDDHGSIVGRIAPSKTSSKDDAVWFTSRQSSPEGPWTTALLSEAIPEFADVNLHHVPSGLLYGTRRDGLLFCYDGKEAAVFQQTAGHGWGVIGAEPGGAGFGYLQFDEEGKPRQIHGAIFDHGDVIDVNNLLPAGFSIIVRMVTAMNAQGVMAVEATPISPDGTFSNETKTYLLVPASIAASQPATSTAPARGR